MEYYQKGNDLVSVGNSILKAYGEKTFHESNKELDEIFKKNNVPNRKVCLFLLDGYGTYIQEVYKNDAPYIYSNKAIQITSVFPPTTVAATTSLLTGKYPYETGWMGWTQKFPMYETPVTMFPSTFIGGNDKTPISTSELVKITTIESIINKTGKYKADSIRGFEDQMPGTDYFFTETKIKLNSTDFIYAYWTDPDSTLHGYGVESSEVRRVVIDLDNHIRDFVEKNKDVLVLTIADHGHINCKYHSIYEHEDFYACLSNPSFANEPRASIFFVKEDKKDEFRKLALKYYGNDFDIYSKQEVIDQQIFGFGEKNKYFDDFIGDFLLIAKSNYAFSQDTTETSLLSHHAGGTDKEKYINIGVYNSL